MSILTETYDSAPSYSMSGVEIAATVAKLLRNEASATKTKLSNFGTPGDYTFDSAKIDLASGAALLKLPVTAQSFVQAFAADTGFTYNSALAEFVAGILRQKDQRPANSVVGATYTTTKNLSWSLGGSLTATDTGTPVLAGGKLECLGGGNNGVRYDAAEIGTSAGNIGALKILYKPNYSGTPGTNTNIFEFAPPTGNNSRMVVFHSATGTLRLTAYTSAGTVKYSAVAFNASPWAPVAGTEYELELNWDTVAGQVRLFIDGALHGAMAVSSYSRGTDANRLYIGAGTVYPVADATFDQPLLFSAVQHTSGYTPGYVVPEATYLETAAVLPAFTHPLVGVIHALTSVTATEVDTPRYFVKVGAGSFLYWNGAAWVASDQSYAQSTALAALSANLGSLPGVDGSTSITLGVAFATSNVQGGIDLVTLNYNGDSTYATDNPSIVMVAQSISEAVALFSLDALSATLVQAGLDLVKFRVSTNEGATWQFWNGSAWAVSSGYAGTNTLAQILANQATLDKSGGKLRIEAFLHSETGLTTPSLDNLQVDYRIFQYRTAGGTIEPNAAMTAQELLEFLAVMTIPSGDAIKFGLRVNGSLVYHNGTAWVASNGANAQLNLAADWTPARLAELLSVNSSVKLYARLTSGDGLTTPELDETQFTFDRGAIEPAVADLCNVSFFVRKMNGDPVPGVKVSFFPKPGQAQYLEAASHIIAPLVIEAYTDENGYGDTPLVYSSAFEGGPMQYRVELTFPGNKKVVYRDQVARTPILVTVPDAVEADITAQLAGLAT